MTSAITSALDFFRAGFMQCEQVESSHHKMRTYLILIFTFFLILLSKPAEV